MGDKPDFVLPCPPEQVPFGEHWRLAVYAPNEDHFTNDVEVAFETVAASNRDRVLDTKVRLDLTETEIEWLLRVLPEALRRQRETAAKIQAEVDAAREGGGA